MKAVPFALCIQPLPPVETKCVVGKEAHNLNERLARRVPTSFGPFAQKSPVFPRKEITGLEWHAIHFFLEDRGDAVYLDSMMQKPSLVQISRLENKLNLISRLQTSRPHPPVCP